MRKAILFLAVAASALCAGRAVAEENRWSVYAGGSINHFCESTYSGMGNYGWGGGAFLGGAYDIRFNSHWSLTPAVEFAYTDNGAITPRGFSEGGRKDSWRSYWQVSIPVMATYRVGLTENVGMRFGAGFYLTEAFAVKRFDSAGANKVTYHTQDGYRAFEDRFNVGAIAEIGVETGSHWSYMVRAQYPCKDYNILRSTLTLSLGVRYTF